MIPQIELLKTRKDKQCSDLKSWYVKGWRDGRYFLN
jgi:hypothetical protein